MGGFESGVHLSALLCEENEVSCYSENGNGDGSCNFDDHETCVVLGSEEIEYVENLIQRETSFGFGCCVSSGGCSRTSSGWLKSARLDAIEWIFHTRAVFGFQLLTAYLSVTYFDRLLSKRSIDEGKLWAVQLLSVACLSIAAKMVECRVPVLSEFPVKDYCFENKSIQRMELFVLTTLEWKMSTITPLIYLRYFVAKICGESKTKELISKAAELIMAMVKGKLLKVQLEPFLSPSSLPNLNLFLCSDENSLDHRPSAIAAAAVLAAYNSQFTRKELELKMTMISPWNSQENVSFFILKHSSFSQLTDITCCINYFLLQQEHILSCFIAMQCKEMEKLKTPEPMITPVSSSVLSNSIDVKENSLCALGAGIKRRLTYEDCDENSPGRKISRQYQDKLIPFKE
ncbi:hypothetical protein K2173_014816 [Erythroxylum novogranatense]|uniref:B-like cyclin n=1 Tax=Erythroxylum novogranatense TaxID=1862640 RepID=A0AAV8THN6_9ROSI|nr:hypothetical protein K2173_014816 [Erythroxylum novogranatense]